MEKKITANPQSQPQDTTERNRQEGLLPQSLSVWRDSNISQNVQPKKTRLKKVKLQMKISWSARMYKQIPRGVSKLFSSRYQRQISRSYLLVSLPEKLELPSCKYFKISLKRHCSKLLNLHYQPRTLRF